MYVRAAKHSDAATLLLCGLQFEVTKRIGTAPCKTVLVLRRSCHAGLQLEVPDCIGLVDDCSMQERVEESHGLPQDIAGT